MKNLKKVLALVLSMALLISTFTVSFAAEATKNLDKATKLHTMDLFNGVSADEFKPALEDATNRIQAIVIIGRMLGWDTSKIKADKADYEFTDVSEGEFADLAQYAFENGITSGIGNNKFGSKDPLTSRMLYAWYYAALGNGKASEAYDNPAVLVDKGIATLTTVSEMTKETLAGKETKLNRDALVGVMFDSLNWSSKDAETTLIEDLVAAGTVDKAKAVAAGVYDEPVVELAIDSVEALNLKEVKVVFTAEVKATRDNFLINGAKVAKENFNLSEDGKEVTLYNVNTTKAGQKIKVVVNGIEGLKTEFYDLVLNDNQLPTIESVETVGNSLIKVTYSEPMDAFVKSISSYRINNRIKSAKIEMSNNNRVANIALTSKLADGEYKLAVDASKVKDFAGNSIGLNETEFAIAKYSSVPGAVVLEASQQDVKVQFDREPKSVKELYWKQGSTKHKSTIAQDKNDRTIFTFHFTDDHRMSAGDNEAYLAEVKDFSGNTAKNVAITFTATVDTVRPEFESITQNANGDFEIKFNKEVVADKDNYTVTDSKGIKKTINSATSKPTDKKVVVVSVSGLNTSRNPYTFRIADVIDTTYLKNRASDIIETVEIKDAKLPEVSSISKEPSKNTLSIAFSEPVDAATITLENFRYKLSAEKTYQAMPAGSYLDVVSSNIVNITVPAKFGPNDSHNISNMHEIYVTDVKDLSGNKIIAISKTFDAHTSVVAIEDFSGEKVFAFDKQTLLMQVDGTLKDVWIGDFVVKAGSETLELTGAELLIADTDVNKYAAVTGHDHKFEEKQLVKLTLEKELSFDAKYKGNDVKVSVVPSNDVQVSKNALGAPLELTQTTVVDSIIPAKLVAANMKYNNNVVLDVVKSFVASETGVIEYFAQKVTADAPDANDGNSTYVNNTKADSFSSVNVNDETTKTITKLDADEELFIRFVDEQDNKSEWVSLGNKAPVATLVDTPTTTDNKFTVVFNSDIYLDGTQVNESYINGLSTKSKKEAFYNAIFETTNLTVEDYGLVAFTYDDGTNTLTVTADPKFYGNKAVSNGTLKLKAGSFKDVDDDLMDTVNSVLKLETITVQVSTGAIVFNN